MSKEGFDLFARRNFLFDMARTLRSWLKGFDGRVAVVEEKLKGSKSASLKKIKRQLEIVKKAEKTCIANKGKTRNNLLTAASKLNEMLCDIEQAITDQQHYADECSFEMRPLHCVKCGGFLGELGTCKDESLAFCSRCSGSEFDLTAGVIWQPNYDKLDETGRPIENLKTRIR